MTEDMRVALFVEGTSQAGTYERTGDPLERLWNETLCARLGLPRFDHIFGISKRHLVAMDPSVKALSSVGESLDQLIARVQADKGFDAAVVAWDLHPRWNPEAIQCRWQETLNLYRGLSASEVLPKQWRNAAALRFRELSQRQSPSMRAAAPRLRPGSVLGLCMDKMFESLVTPNESAVRRAFGVAGTRVPGWPRWDAATATPDRSLLAPAVAATRRLRPVPDSARRVRGGFDTRKTEWADYLIGRMLDSDDDRHLVADHPISVRLREVVAR